MPWQEWAVAVVGGGAVLYLARRTWRTWAARGGACGGGCGKSCGESPAKEAPTLIPSGELTLRRR